MTRVAAVMQMRNEADIIESWIRFYAQLVDVMVIADHRSDDESGDIARERGSEGLPVELLAVDSLGFEQATTMTSLMRKAVSEHGADWVLLLDADEFLVPPSGSSVKDLLAGQSRAEPVDVPWRSYIPTSDDTPAPNLCAGSTPGSSGKWSSTSRRSFPLRWQLTPM